MSNCLHIPIFQFVRYASDGSSSVFWRCPACALVVPAVPVTGKLFSNEG